MAHTIMDDIRAKAKEGNWTLAITEVDRIKQRYDAIRDLDFKIFDVNMNIRDAKHRVNVLISEINLMEGNIASLKQNRQEHFQVIAKISERCRDVRLVEEE